MPLNSTKDFEDTNVDMSTQKTILASVGLSWILTIVTVILLRVAMASPGVLSAKTIIVGGGAGEGSITLSTQAQNGGAHVVLAGSAGGGTIDLSVMPKGFPSITLTSDDGKPALILERPANASGQPRIRVFDKVSGSAGWMVTLDANGKPVIEPR